MEINELMNMTNKWAADTFKEDSTQPHLVIDHLVEELNELIVLPHDGEEMADVILLVFRLAGIFDVDIEKAILAKHEINTARTWKKDAFTGGWRHVKLVRT